ncbi:hypothetical protein JL721_6807 [Aureococcus anophagefferens]|nr:hypothetical protein JL721_6807 [Aureococcus anophagefferens]
MCSTRAAALVAALPTLLALSARRAPFSARRAPRRQRTLMSAALRGAPPSSRVVILGGGLQGCAAAYYLKERGFDDVTVVERTAVAAAASGKGGGFLARGWGSGPTKALHERSFDLHEELAGDLGLASYRKIKTMEVTGELGLREWPPVAKATEKPKNVGAPKWLDDEDTGARLMDPNTAQVVPRELCEKLFERFGATLVVGAARGLETADAGGDARVTGVSVEDGAGATTTVPCDVLVCAMGVWSVLLEDWLGAGGQGRNSQLEASFRGRRRRPAEPVALFCAEDSNCATRNYASPAAHMPSGAAAGGRAASSGLRRNVWRVAPGGGEEAPAAGCVALPALRVPALGDRARRAPIAATPDL